MAAKTLVISREDALAQRRWVVVDADGRALGRVATRSRTCCGKGKPTSRRTSTAVTSSS
jgi:ribosomal protein L13